MVVIAGKNRLPWYEVIITVSYRNFVQAIDEDDAQAKGEHTSGIVLPHDDPENLNLSAEMFVRSVSVEYVREH
jgi:hypothetical protein